MAIRHLEDFRDPESHEALHTTSSPGTVASKKRTFEVVRDIPRFVPKDNYAQSFGYQWQQFSDTQLDSKSNWGAESEKRFFAETRWPREMTGQRILEAGSGMGRFTEVVARTGAHVCTFDYSEAIDANFNNNKSFENVSFAQADIYNPPYERGSFDKVMCLGVLQHCPSPKQAFMSLSEFLKPGGEIVIDIYRLSWKSLLYGKYYLRPLTRRLSATTLRRLVRGYVGSVFPVTGVAHKLVGGRARAVSMMLGVSDYRGVINADEGTLRQLSELDTFDMLAPTYDRPQTLSEVRYWFEEAGLVNIEVGPGYNGVEGRGTRPQKS